jgi:hypothetical protein
VKLAESIWINLINGAQEPVLSSGVGSGYWERGFGELHYTGLQFSPNDHNF